MRTWKFFGTNQCVPGLRPRFLPVMLICAAAFGAACGRIHDLRDSASTPEIAAGKPAHWYPNEEITPGHLCTPKDPDFDEHRYPEEIPHCARNVSHSTRVKVSAPYGVTEDELPDFQVDHLIPLALGGSNSELNLWPVPYAQARAKAKVEYATFNELKDGRITQSQAITKIRQWVRDNLRKP